MTTADILGLAGVLSILGSPRLVIAEPVVRCDGNGLRLVVTGPEWTGWREMCERLRGFVGESRDADDVERKLGATGYFGEVVCVTKAEIVCHVTARDMVRQVEIEGDVPFPLLASDLERRLMLRPGTALAPGLIERQLDRLHRYLRREGIFGVAIDVETIAAGEIGANRAVDVIVRLSGGNKLAVGNVEVRGDPVVSSAEVARRLHHSWIPYLVSERFSPGRLRRDADELASWLRRRGWPEARVRADYTLDEKRGVADVTVTIDSGPELTLVFAGNHELDADDLRDVATFVDSGSVDQVEVDATVERIVELYQREGYFAVAVSAAVHADSRAQSTVELTIEEGEPAVVRSIDFAGNLQIDARKLSGLELRTRTEGVFRSGRWVDAWAEEDCETITEHYRTRGFANVAVTAEKRVTAPGDLAVIFRIDEGPRQQVAKVSVAGMRSDAGDVQLSHVDGGAFREDRVERDRQRLLVRLAQAGYLGARVESSVRDDGPGAKTIVYTVDAGARAVLGGVLSRGNGRTNASFLARELDLEIGAPVRLESLSNGRRRLRGLGIFHAVELEPLPADDPTNTWVLVAVQEREVRALDLAAAFSTDDLFSIGLDYSDRNFLGHAVSLDIGLRFANATELGWEAARIGNADRLSLSLRAPHPLGAPFDVNASARLSYEDRRLFVEQRALGGVGLSRQVLTRGTCSVCPDAVVGLGYEVSATRFREKQNTEETLAGVPFEGSFRLVPTVTLDRTDSFIAPQRGYRCSAQLAIAHPALGGGLDANTYWRFVAVAGVFVPLFTPFTVETDGGTRLGGPVLVTVGARYGAAQPFGGDQRLPETEAFYYGGDLSVRGMEPRASTVAVVEGRYLTTGTAELRWRLFPDTPVGAFELGGFLDAGTVAHGLPDLFGEVAVSTGPSLRIVTLVGPLAVSYAWPVIRPARVVASDPRAMPQRGRLHVTFGAAY